MPIDFLSTGNNSTTSSQNRQTEFDALDKFFREEIDKCLQDTKQKNISWLEENHMKLIGCGIDEQSYVDLLKDCRSKMQQTTQLQL